MIFPRHRLLNIDRSPLGPEVDRVFRFMVDGEYYDHVEEHGPAWKFAVAVQLREVISNPTVIFCGLNRENFHDAFCYCGAIAGDDSLLTGRLFAAFAVYDEDNGFFFFDWEIRVEDRRKKGFPQNWTDFGEPQWQH